MTEHANLAKVLAEFVQYQRIGAATAAIVASGDVVLRDEHNAAVKREFDWQHYWLEKYQAVDLERGRLQRLLNLTSVERTRKVLADLELVPRQKAAKHDPGCWQRHAGCLAQRIGAHLDGEEPR